MISELPLSPINHSSIRQFSVKKKKYAELPLDLNPLWNTSCCAIWKTEKVLQQQQAPAAAFPSRLSGGYCQVVKQAFVVADRAGTDQHWEITQQNNNQFPPTVLRKKELPNTRRTWVEMKPTQSGTVYLRISLFLKVNRTSPPSDRRKKENEKKEEKTTETIIAYSSNAQQQIIMPSPRLINGHQVIDIHKRRVGFISGFSHVVVILSE